MCKTALDWKEFPVEVVDLLVEVSAQGVANKGKWISLLYSLVMSTLVAVCQLLKGGGGGVFLCMGDEHRML
jgi:hypothetical protein